MKKLSILLILVVMLSVVTGCVIGEETTVTTTEQAETELTPTETTVASHVHSFGDWVDTKAPTCTLAGEKTRTCSCGEKETASIDALGHTEIVDNGVEATCTTPGLSEGKHCSTCNVVTVTQQYVAALGHNEVILSAVAPTCTQEGKTEGKICNRCQATFVYQTQIPVTGHSEVVDKAVDPTCTQTGLTEGKHCSVCNLVIVAQTTLDALGHTEVTDKAVAATCTTSGKTEGKHCSKCNLIILSQNNISATGHKYNSGTITKPATCTGDGQKTYTCTNKNCKDSYTEAFKATAYSATELYDLSVKYVGEIITYDKSGKELAIGTGFVYSSDGKIITNYHVIEDAYSAKITINGKTYNIVSILAYDEDIDLAVLKVNASNLVSANICKQPTKTGESIYAIGSSRGLTNTFSQGMITQSNRIIDGVTYIQHDASITHGNSGGPLINAYGEVIGINTWGVADSQNLNFAVFTSELDNLAYCTPISLSDLYMQNLSPYDVLLEWLVQNSTSNNSNYLSYTYRTSSNIQYSLSYKISDEVMYVSIIVPQTSTYYWTYLEITPELEYTNYCGELCVNEQNGDVISGVYGRFKASTLTSSSKIPYDSYYGNDYYRTVTIDSCGVFLHDGLHWLNWVFAVNKLDLSLYDLGFKSYIIE